MWLWPPTLLQAATTQPLEPCSEVHANGSRARNRYQIESVRQLYWVGKVRALVSKILSEY